MVHLGAESQQSPLNDSVFDTRPLYVVAWFVNSTGTFRLPPQKLEKVPHAITAERAHDFEVSDTLTTHALILGGKSLHYIPVGTIVAYWKTGE